MGKLPMAPGYVIGSAHKKGALTPSAVENAPAQYDGKKILVV
jgi:hypothetical protein